MEFVDKSMKDEFCVQLLMELTIVGRIVWADDKLDDREKVDGLKRINELNHRTINTLKSKDNSLEGLWEIFSRQVDRPKMSDLEIVNAWKRATEKVVANAT